MEILSSPGEVPKPLVDRLCSAQPHIPVTSGLIAINIAIFIAMLFFGAGLWHTSSEVQLAWGANFGPATKDNQWWRLGSALFLHFGAIHLAMNMWALWDVGRLVERMYGSARFVLLYLLAGLGGNLLSLILRGEHAISGGASGAIFGLYGALLVSLWQERHDLHPQEFRWLFWGGTSFALAIVAIGQLLPFIDNAAHAGGLMAGAIAGIALQRPLNPEHDFPLFARLTAALCILSSTVLLIINIPASRYRWSEELQARQEINSYLREDAAIGNRWQTLMEQAQHPGGPSFEQLAGEIENKVANPYEDTFEKISRIHVNQAAPSAATLYGLRQYAALRRDSSRTLVDGLRSNDQRKIKAAIDLVRQSGKAGKPLPGQAGVNVQPKPIVPAKE